jgi:molybdopterin-binding protein
LGKCRKSREGPITATIKQIDSPSMLKAIISKESVEDLDIEEGDEVSA